VIDRAVDRMYTTMHSWKGGSSDRPLGQSPRGLKIEDCSWSTTRSTNPRRLHNLNMLFGLVVDRPVDRYMKPIDRTSGLAILSWFQFSVFEIKFQSELGFLLLIIPLAI